MSQVRLETVTNKAGKKLREAIGHEITRCAKANEYIKLKFWEDLAKEFDLGYQGFTDLQVPEPDEYPYEAELKDIMKEVAQKSPTKKATGVKRLVRFLQVCEQFNVRQLYGLLLESRESVLMMPPISFQIQWAIIQYMAKFDIHKDWPQGWEVIRGRMEDVVIDKWSRTPSQCADVGEICSFSFNVVKLWLFV